MASRTQEPNTLSPARQEEEEEEEEKKEEVRGDSKPHSQDNGRSVGLAETLRALGHVEEKGEKLREKGRKKDVKKCEKRLKERKKESK